jgi:multidrug efflux system outer membrane protein
MRTRNAGLVVLIAAVGCAVGPNYRSPEPPVPTEWSEPRLGGATDEEAEVVRWWAAFNDPTLDSLIERAVGSNHDLRVAVARVREARALRTGVAADLFPSFDALASLTDDRRSQNSLTFPITQLDSDLYEAAFDASWELDVFGGTRRALEAATADLAAAVEDARDVLITLLAEVARNYIEARGFQGRLAIAHRNMQAQSDVLDLTRSRFAAGLANELDVSRAAAVLASTRAQVPTLETSLHQAMHRLGVLLGQEPGALIAELSTDRPIPAPPPEVPVGLPADLLRRRPDVRRSERQLAAVTARIGVATAELFPKFSLTSLAGFQSLHTSDLFTSGSRFWSAGPSVTWRILDVARVRAGIRVQDARQEQALAQYEKTVLTSLEDAENALVAYAKEQVRYASLNDAVEANRRTLGLANELYAKGLSDFLSVLDAERSLYLAEDQLVQSEANISVGLVALYKALGGGWEEAAETQATYTPAAAE